MTVPVQFAASSPAVPHGIWFVIGLAALVYLAMRSRVERPRWMGISADVWVVVFIALMLTFASQLEAVVITCSCPFKDATECYWWRLLYC